MWLDTSSAIGTTAITGRLISAEHVIPVNYGYKYLAVGPTGSKTYTRTGRGKRSMTQGCSASSRPRARPPLT